SSSSRKRSSLPMKSRRLRSWCGPSPIAGRYWASSRSTTVTNCSTSEGGSASSMTKKPSRSNASRSCSVRQYSRHAVFITRFLTAPGDRGHGNNGTKSPGAPLHQIAGVSRHPVGILAFPLDIAADGIGHRRAHRLPGQVFLQGSLEIIDRHLGPVARIVHSSSGVDELPVL